MIKSKTKTSQGMEGARRATGISWDKTPKEPDVQPSLTVVPPDPEVCEKPARRRFSADYKARILALADTAVVPGSVGALLRREGLYSSQLAAWRRQRRQGALAALKPKPRGRKKTAAQNPEIDRLQKENARLAARLKQAELIIDVQKKVSEMLGAPQNPLPESEEP
jgi:transposase-like protein